MGINTDLSKVCHVVCYYVSFNDTLEKCILTTLRKNPVKKDLLRLDLSFSLLDMFKALKTYLYKPTLPFLPHFN